MAPLRAETQRRVGLLVLMITTLVTGLFLSTTNCPSRARHARAVTISPPPSAVAVSIDEGASWEPFVRVARVVQPGAPEVVPEGEACAVEVTPVNDGMFDCRVAVRCGDQVLYGDTSTGYNFCGPVPSRVVDANFTRDDGDPRLELDLASGSVVIEERVGLGVQRVELQITD